MPTNISGRVTLILVILWGSLSLIWPTVPPSLFWFFHPTQQIILKPNLKPGIDMVGGTSLLYEIKTPEGAYQSDLAEQVMESLKKRVDPDGVRNLIWRPQGNTRLEIQMPLTDKSESAKQQRDAFLKVQKELEDTNIRPGEVIYVVQELKGDERTTKLKQLEAGSETRAKLFGALASTWDQIEQAKAAKNAGDQARLEDQWEKLVDQLAATNLKASDLQAILDLKKAETRDQRLADLKKKFADFPARLAAMDNFIKEYAGYSQVKDSIEDAADLKRLLRGSGVLEFHILANDLPQSTYQEMVDRLKSRGPVVQPGDEVRWYQVENPEEFKSGGTVELNEKHYALCYITPEKSMTHSENMPKWGLQTARVGIISGERVVEFTFDPEGAKLFGDLTGANIGRALAIVLDEKLISAPNLRSQIFGSGQITGGGPGGFSKKDADYLVRTLNAGSLPAQLNDEPISEQTVGPQLGADNLRAGLMASIIGLIAVAIFMVIYYHISGIVAVVALVMNMVLILGVMAALNATWTLPAVAGIVLTIGMSVDANVLVFERLREEQARGLSLRMALKHAYDRALSAIVDSNAVTAITCVILYWLGSEEVKGFGLTLLIGLISSLFTALFVTKTIFAVMLNYFNLQHLGSLPETWPALGKALHPNINWMRLSKYFMACSAILIALGAVAMIATFRRGELFDIEFSSGTSVQFNMKQPTPIENVRAMVARAPEAELPSPSIVSVGTGDKTYEVVTPSNDSVKVKQAILDSLEGQLDILQPSNFEYMDASAADAMSKAIFPITADMRSVGGMSPAQLRSHSGGVAIVLKDMNPTLSANEIKNRMEQVRLQPQAGSGKMQAYRDVDVEVSSDGKTAVVMTSDPTITYEPNDPIKLQQWTDELVKPTWANILEGVHNPPKLQKVSNFDAQVAGEMQRDALVALSLSLIVIMAYIWLRFGNLKYGTATVAAMLHDTLLVIGFIGMSHFIGRSGLGHALLIEPFRVNLTLVAAVLTVMSYSMVDTIVVFDRIRENRGKFGHVDPQVINDSVNQTLSRTLLTVFSTTLTVTVMYIFGGPGIHGFTFVMIIGILIGTYSSFAIAAPILLIGEKQPPPQKPKTPTRASGGQRQLQGA